jgi:hypothetical protein
LVTTEELVVGTDTAAESRAAATGNAWEAADAQNRIVSILLHELEHAFVSTEGRVVTRWYDEGRATYYGDLMEAMLQASFAAVRQDRAFFRGATGDSAYRMLRSLASAMSRDSAPVRMEDDHVGRSVQAVVARAARRLAVRTKSADEFLAMLQARPDSLLTLDFTELFTNNSPAPETDLRRWYALAWAAVKAAEEARLARDSVWTAYAAEWDRLVTAPDSGGSGHQREQVSAIARWVAATVRTWR